MVDSKPIWTYAYVVLTYHKAFPFLFKKLNIECHVIHSRTIYQNITKVITEFQNNYPKLPMFKTIILDLAIRLLSKCSSLYLDHKSFFYFIWLKVIVNKKVFQCINV